MRSGIILIDSGRVALIERNREGRIYYVFPGGQVELSESREVAARREALEELGVEVRLGRLAAIVETPDRKQYYYTAVAVGGVFGSGEGEELDSPADSSRGSYRPVWLDIEVLPRVDVRPRSLAGLVATQRLQGAEEVFILRD